MPSLRVHDRSRDRYHALSISKVWQLDRLRKAKALVVGAGALGNEVIKNLAMMGVSLIVVLDRDTVETANLTRSIFFREADHGRAKTEALAGRVKELNPDVEVLPLTGDIDELLSLGVVRRMDLIFSCLDSRIARRSLSRMCEKVGRPWVDGAMEDLFGEVTAYSPGKGPCYECTLSRVDQEIIAEARSCRGIALQKISAGKVPTTPTMGSIVSALEVQEALKLLHGDEERSLVGRRLVLNCVLNDFYTVNYQVRPDCPGHTRFGAVEACPDWTSAATTAKELLEKFRAAASETGRLNLGREVITGLTCSSCNKSEKLDPWKTIVKESHARCAECGELRVPETTFVVEYDSPQSSWTLDRLGVPRLEVLQVEGAGQSKWYELTGDLASFPPRIST